MLCNGDFRIHLWWCETTVLSKCFTETVKTETNSLPVFQTNGKKAAEKAFECKRWKILSL